jgi:hypothetical protein
VAELEDHQSTALAQHAVGLSQCSLHRDDKGLVLVMFHVLYRSIH